MSLIEEARSHLRGLTSSEVSRLCDEVLHEKHEAWLEAERVERLEVMRGINALIAAGFKGNVEIVDVKYSKIEEIDIQGLPFIKE